MSVLRAEAAHPHSRGVTDPATIQMRYEAREFLREMDPRARSQGRAYHRRAPAGDIARLSDTAFVVGLKDTREHSVAFEFDEDTGWSSECTCPMKFDCKHIFAAMTALLEADFLSTDAGGGVHRTPSPLEKAAGGNRPVRFAAEVKEALGRPLSSREKEYLQRLTRVYERCRQARRITHWDFDELGFRLPGYGWEVLDIWPAFPESEKVFWLHVANAVTERGLSVPEFMAPVSDLAPLKERLRDWQRLREIDRWKRVIEEEEDHSRALIGADRAEPHELRLKITPGVAVLEWRGPNEAEFTPLRPTQARLLGQLHLENAVRFPPETDWLWSLFADRLNAGETLEMRLNHPGEFELIGRLLRMPACFPLLVNENGEPFRRAERALRWQLDAAPDSPGDYCLRLVQEDGSPVSNLSLAFNGNPTLYLTRDTLFTGPPLKTGVLNPAVENRVPAPALETAGGASLLHSLDIELPPRLRERVRPVPLRAVLVCRIEPNYRGSPTEYCVIRPEARTMQGRRVETWNGASWQDSRGGRRMATEERNGTITLYDRSTLASGGLVLGPLSAKWDVQRGGYSVRVTRKFPSLFAAWIQSLPGTVELELHGELVSFKEDPVRAGVRLDVNEGDIDWFDLKVVLDVAETDLTPDELKLLLDAGGQFVRLKGRGWRKLDFDLSDEEDERLARLGLNPRELSSEPQHLHALQLADPAAKKLLPEEQFARIERRAGEIKARVTPDLPPTIQASLRPYQCEGFHFLAYLSENRFGGILADDMGLGKTLQTLTWLAWLKENQSSASNGDASHPVLVVCPKSVMDNWRAEAARFLSSLSVKVWPARELNDLPAKTDTADLHVINYSQLRLLGESLAPVRWLAVILDEGQYIKNPGSQTAQIARGLHARHRLVLSGTPIENRLLDLWSLMAFTMPGLLGSRAQFAKLYDSKEDPHARRRLSSRVRPFLLRRTKTQVAKDLPDRIEEDLYCEIEGEQLMLYRAELKRARQLLLKVKTQKELAKQQFHFLTSLLRLRQICCDPRLVKPDITARGAKIDSLLEHIEPLMDEGHKVLVFSQFVEMLDLLRAELKPRGWPLFQLTGSTENRGDLIDRFQSAVGGAVFLISLKAGGFGLNLTAASYVVLFDPWWNPAVENQAIDRTHRIGQTRNVIAYRLLIKDSIEEKIRQLQKQKSALAEDVLGEEKFSQSLTLDDLRFLFADPAVEAMPTDTRPAIV